tara:strand:- start:1747 stop:2088 length:342 start_codon:yes stop_codon:yes gene_type:complete
MSSEIFVIALAAIGFGSGLIFFIVKNIFDVIKTRSNTKEAPGQIDPQFFKALSEFKKTTERRITNLETIVSDIEEEKIRVPDSNGVIEIEPLEVRSAEDKDENGSNLRNMLNE